MYISVKNLDQAYLELTVGKSRPDRGGLDFDYDDNLLVDGIASRIYRSVSFPLQMGKGIDTWIMLFHYSRDWKKELEKVFTDLKLDFTWEYDDWLECSVNDYIYSQSANKSTSN